MIEPLEETRTELTFVTEPIVDSLNGVVQRMVGDSRGRRGEEELDEVEVSFWEDMRNDADVEIDSKRSAAARPGAWVSAHAGETRASEYQPRRDINQHQGAYSGGRRDTADGGIGRLETLRIDDDGTARGTRRVGDVGVRVSGIRLSAPATGSVEIRLLG